ncbi:hypothetical protein LTR84_010391 [Exophiala bonariae]|uniref:F-box domain-containing protein n=1 Tax=Exophiala bonariae TaxID=1690606 RepID=A0AAV9MTX1_9EURO|nr:hypothetical protein LTR84_010391 [Exophiala bonariae]
MATETQQPTLRITDLELEIVSEIFHYVNDESPRTLSSLALVNSYFHSAVKLVKYHRTSINWSDDQSTWFVARKKFVPAQPNQPASFKLLQSNVSCKDPVLLKRVRVLTVESRTHDLWEWKFLPEADRELIDILSKAANIKVLIWKWVVAPSAGIVEALEKYHPKAQLRISRINVPQIAHDGDTVRAELAAKALRKATCLQTFAVRRYGTDDVLSTFDYRLIISQAPNLEYVSLIGEHREPESGDVPRKPKHSKLRHLTLDGWELSQATVEYWSKYVDCASLVSFKCSRGALSSSYFECAANLLPSLEHVSLNLSPHTCPPETAAAVQRYIANCAPLTKLSLWSWMGKVSLQTILDHHGRSLVSLQLHEREEMMDPSGPKVMSLEDLRSIRTNCPNLKSLTFDLKRKSKKPSVNDYLPILEEIVKMNLDTLEIYLDSGLPFLSVVNRFTQFPEDEAEDDEDYEDDEEYDEDDEDDNEERTLNKNKNKEKDTNFTTRAVIYEKCDAMARNSCGGAFDSRELDSLPDTKYVLNSYFWDRDPESDKEVSFHPPTSADDISTFTGEMWKFIYGARVIGPRTLDLKFGEWERKSMPNLSSLDDGAAYRDIRVWTRARPHERDDKAGQCFAEMKCCGGKHWKKWTTS